MENGTVTRLNTAPVSSRPLPTTPHRRLSRLGNNSKHHNNNNNNTVTPRLSRIASNTPSQRTLQTQQQQQQQQQPFHLSPDITDSIEELADSFQTLRDNFENLKRVSDALTEFNGAFGAFLQGLQLAGVGRVFEEAPIPETYGRVGPTKYQIRRLTDNISNPAWLPKRSSSSPQPNPAPTVAAKSPLKEIGNVVPTVVNEAASKPKPIAKPKQPPFVTKKILDALPIKYRDNPHRATIELIIKALRQTPEGLYIQDIAKLTGMKVPKTRCHEYLNVLTHSKHIVKFSQRGLLYRLDPVQYPPKGSSK